MKDCGFVGRRVSQGGLLCVLLFSVVALGASGGTGTAAGDRNVAVASSLVLLKTADAEAVDAGDPIGFRIDLTNRGGSPGQGRIIIENRAYPVGIAGSFTFSGDLGAFLIAQPDRATTFKALSPGTYNVTQATRPANIELQTLSCNDSDTPDSSVNGATATIQLQAGETVRCVYTNRLKVGRIIIENRAYPVGIAGSFTFSGDLGAFLIAQPDRATTFKALSPGTYNVTQATRPANIELQTLSCNDSDTPDSSVNGATATVQLQAGETVRCVYTNRLKVGRIIIENRAYPVGIAGSFTFSGDLGAFLIAQPDRATTFKALSPGTYNVTQATRPANIELQTLSCNDSDTPDSSVNGATATVQLQAGETVRCVYTNANVSLPPSSRGRVLIEKQAPAVHLPLREPFGIFEHNFFGSTALTGLIASGNDLEYSVEPGTYTVSEIAPSLDQFVSLRCDDTNSETNSRTATIRIEANEIVRCVWVNRDSPARVLIEKQAPAVHLPLREPFGIFEHNFFGSTALTGLIASGNDLEYSVEPGTYTVSEIAPSLDQFVSLRCDDTNSETNSRTATIRIEANEIVRCVWVNRDSPARVLIEKQAPAVHLPLREPFGIFEHNFFGSTALTGLIASGNDLEYSVEPGTYTVSEIAPSLDQFVSLRCDDTNSETNSRTATIRIEANEIVRCVWVNTAGATGDPARNVTLTDDLPAGPGLGWSLDPALGDCSLEGNRVACTFSELADGATVSVHVSSRTTTASCGRYENTAVATADNRARVEASASLTVVCPGNIVVRKRTLPSGSTQSFSFTAAYEPTGFSLTDGQSHTSPLGPGSYSVSENAVSGWDTNASCSDGSPPNDISLSAGETVTCTFTNTKRGSVSLKKMTNGVVDPSKDITFVLTGPGLPSAGITRSTFGDQDGVLEWPNLVPGQYKICETPVPAGFTSFWKLDGVIVTPDNPDASKSPPEDLGNRCYDFQVSPGQARAFEVDNSRPGGDPRTIGYWKNWNRCTSGNQAATAEKNGGAAAGFFLVEDLLPQRIGDFDVTTCQQAVKLLSKQDQAGKSKSSDAAYELGAQLLAARFNLAAGAETCAAVPAGGPRRSVAARPAQLHRLRRLPRLEVEGRAPRPGALARRHARPLQQRQPLLRLSARGGRSPPRRDDRPSPPELHRSPRLLLAEHAVDRRARGARHLRKLLLGERDHRVAAGVERAQLRKAAEHAPLDRDVERLEQELVLAGHLLGEEADQHLVDLRVLPAQPLELRDVDDERLRLLERLDGGGAPPPPRAPSRRSCRPDRGCRS